MEGPFYDVGCFFKDASRCSVVDLTRSKGSFEVELFESCTNHPSCCFCGVSLAPHIASEYVTQICLALVLDGEVTSSNKTVVCAANDGELPSEARLFYLTIEHTPNVISAIRFISRPVEHVAGYFWVGRVRMYRTKIRLNKVTQNQAGSLKRKL